MKRLLTSRIDRSFREQNAVDWWQFWEHRHRVEEYSESPQRQGRPKW